MNFLSSVFETSEVLKGVFPHIGTDPFSDTYSAMDKWLYLKYNRKWSFADDVDDQVVVTCIDSILLDVTAAISNNDF